MERICWSVHRTHDKPATSYPVTSIDYQYLLIRSSSKLRYNALPKVPRPQEKIKAIAKDKYGLVLESGRQINWTLVAIKIEKNELDLSGDTAPRLLTKLQELGIGKNTWGLLAKYPTPAQ